MRIAQGAGTNDMQTQTLQISMKRKTNGYSECPQCGSDGAYVAGHVSGCMNKACGILFAFDPEGTGI